MVLQHFLSWQTKKRNDLMRAFWGWGWSTIGYYSNMGYFFFLSHLHLSTTVLQFSAPRTFCCRSVRMDPSPCHNGSRSILKKNSYFDLISGLYNLLPLLISEKILAWISTLKKVVQRWGSTYILSYGHTPSNPTTNEALSMIRNCKLQERSDNLESKFTCSQFFQKTNLILLP